jgi:phosphoribosylglycinamide formyltransferase-1
MKRIAIFASGSGSNAENIYSYFKDSDQVKIEFILTNKYDAFVIQRAKRLKIPVVIVSKSSFRDGVFLQSILKEYPIDLIVLAGFLLLIPEYLIKSFPNKIINIHPALLPKYGGKGMYGMNVHRTVIENNESESGISIHYVNEKYDEGEIILQESCSISPQDTAEDVAKKVGALEYEFFPVAISKVLGLSC